MVNQFVDFIQVNIDKMFRTRSGCVNIISYEYRRKNFCKLLIDDTSLRNIKSLLNTLSPF